MNHQAMITTIISTMMVLTIEQDQNATDHDQHCQLHHDLHHDHPDLPGPVRHRLGPRQQLSEQEPGTKAKVVKWLYYDRDIYDRTDFFENSLAILVIGISLQPSQLP